MLDQAGFPLGLLACTAVILWAIAASKERRYGLATILYFAGAGGTGILAYLWQQGSFDDLAHHSLLPRLVVAVLWMAFLYSISFLSLICAVVSLIASFRKQKTEPTKTTQSELQTKRSHTSSSLLDQD